MATVNVHTGVMTSPKFGPLSDGAFRLWFHGLMWSKEHLTDGFIPTGMLPTLHRQAKRLTAELLRVHVPGKGPLWHQEPEGYRIHDFADWQDVSEVVQGRRRKWREQKRGVKATSVQDSTPDSAVESILDSRAGGGSGGGVGGGCGGGNTASSDDDAVAARRARGSSSSTPPETQGITATAASANRGGPYALAVQELIALWNGIRTQANAVRLPLGPKEYQPILIAAQTRSLDEWEATFRRVEASDYLAGRGTHPPLSIWKAIDMAGRIDSGEFDPIKAPAPTSKVDAIAEQNARVFAAYRAQKEAGRG